MDSDILNDFTHRMQDKILQTGEYPASNMVK